MKGKKEVLNKITIPQLHEELSRTKLHKLDAMDEDT
jgi:hypothetical protein